MSDPDNLDLAALVEAGLLEEVETTPSAEYDEGQALITVTLTKNQAALIVFSLMDQSKSLPLREQIEWTRLAIGLNDMIVSAEADDGTEEPD